MSICPGEDDIICFTDKSSGGWEKDETSKPPALMATLLSLLCNCSAKNNNLVIPFLQAIHCELLQPGQRWKSGTLRLKLEFIPDEAEEQEALLLLPSQENSVQEIVDVD